MGLEIVTIAKSRNCSKEEAHAFSNEVLALFGGEKPSLGIVAWGAGAVGPGPAQRVAARIARHHPRFQEGLDPGVLALLAPAPPPEPLVPRPLPPLPPAPAASPPKLRKTGATPAPNFPINKRVGPPRGQRMTAANLKRNRRPGRVNPDKRRTCPHGVRSPQVCAICEPERFRELNGEL